MGASKTHFFDIKVDEALVEDKKIIKDETIEVLDSDKLERPKEMTKNPTPQKNFPISALISPVLKIKNST